MDFSRLKHLRNESEAGLETEAMIRHARETHLETLDSQTDSILRSILRIIAFVNIGKSSAKCLVLDQARFLLSAPSFPAAASYLKSRLPPEYHDRLLESLRILYGSDSEKFSKAIEPVKSLL
jgi:hypothetical protein